MSELVSAGGAGGAVFRQLDDIAWTEVQRQRNADGSVSAVRERWPIIRPGFLSAYVHYEAGMVVRRHGHRSNHVVIVLGGGGWIGGQWCWAGTHVHVPLGAAFGPIVAGPDGLTCWEVSFGEFGGWGDEPELYAREIEARGITPLPDPPLDLGEWFRDPRGDWGAERATPKVEGLAERITLLDGMPWTVVRRQRNADGTVSCTRARWAVETPGFTSAAVRHDPGMVVPRQRREGHHLVLVVEGGAWFGERWCGAGTHVEVPPGSALGPVVAGDRGAAFLELTDGGAGTTVESPEADERVLAARGANPLPAGG